MPRIRRWHPVSHDFVRDPEVQELRRRFGDWAGMLWLEMLSIADRNDGNIKGDPMILARWSKIVWVDVAQEVYDEMTESERRLCKWSALRARKVFDWMMEKAWIVRTESGFFVRNYAEYHRKREHKQSHKGTQEVPSFLPSYPSVTNKKELAGDSAPATKVRTKKPPDPRVKTVIDAWHHAFSAKFGKPPPVGNGAKAGAVAQKLLAGRSEIEALDLVRKFFESAPDFYAERGLYELHHILAAAPQLLAKPKSPYENYPEARICKACLNAGCKPDDAVHLWRAGQRLEPCPQEPA